MSNALRLTLGLMLSGKLLAAGFMADVFSSPYLPTPAPEVSEEQAPAADEGTPFAEVIADCDTLSGLFNVYHNPKTGIAWLEVSPQQLGREYILHITRETGLGIPGWTAGMPAQHAVFQLQHQRDQIRLVLQHTRIRSKPGSMAQKMVEGSRVDSPVFSWTIASAPEPERGSWLVKLDDWVLGDYLGIGNDLDSSFKTRHFLDDSQSDYALLKSFEQNLEIGARQTFRTTDPERWSAGSAVREAMEFVTRYSICELPQSDYVPRYADTRIGYFTLQWREWGDDAAHEPVVEVIKRWHLQKKDPEAALSEPVKPIVFWLENTIPEEYRPYVTQGLLLWNRAFEAAGFKDAVVVKQQPDDAEWDPADIRYNTIRWISSSRPAFGAMGPSQANPYTGELLNADVLIEADMMRRNAVAWYRSVRPLENADVDELLQERFEQWQLTPGSVEHEDLCQKNISQQLQASFGDMALASVSAAASGLPFSDEEEEEIVRQYLIALIAHEVGHTFGLRHNFAGSRMLSFEQLSDTSITRRQGMVSSIMEYDPITVMADRSKQGDYFSQNIGPYDVWAIQWGYSPSGMDHPAEEEDFLEAIASRSTTEAALWYSTDEDGWGGADPQARTFDMGSDEAAWVANQRELTRKILQADPARILEDGDDPGLYRAVIERAMERYWNTLNALAGYAGAVHLRREPYGQGLVPAEPYDPAEVRGMITLMLDETFDDELWQFSLEQRELMGPGWTWGESLSRKWPYLYNFNAELLKHRVSNVVDLYWPERLERIVEIESNYDNAYTLEEHFSSVRKRIWKQPARDFAYRGLQRTHMHLMGLLMLEMPRISDEIRMMARADLNTVQSQLKRWQQQNLDRVSRAHISEMLVRVDAILERDRERM